MSRRVARCLAAALAVALAGALAACGGNGGGDGGGARATGDGDGGTLIIAAPATPSTLDKDISGNPQSWEAMANVLEPLIDWAHVPDPENPTALIPDFTEFESRLAESWEVSEDGKSVTFTLRKGVLSHAGNELTAEDVKWTYERAFGLEAIGAFMSGGAGLTSADDVTVEDKYTVTFRTNAASPLVLEMHTNEFLGILDSVEAKKHVTEDDPWATEWLNRNSASYGPFKLESLQPGQQAVFVAHEDYYRGAPSLDTILYREVPESANRLAIVTRGDAHVAYDLLPREVQSVADNSELTVLNFKSNFFSYALMNADASPWDDARVRQAVNYALPYEEILDSVYQGFGRRLTSPLPDIFPCSTDEFYEYDTDLDRARALLTEAGHPDGFEATLTYNEDQPDLGEVALLMETSLDEIGVNIELQPLSGAAFDKRLRARELDFALWKEGPIHGDPDYALRLYFHSDGFNDYGNYGNAELDEMLDSGRAILDLEERCAHYARAQEKILDDAPWGFIAFTGYQVVTTDEVEGYTWRSLNFPDWETMKLTATG